MERSLPQGILRIYAQGAVNTHANKESVAELTKMLNKTRKLDETFYDPARPDVLYTNRFPDTSAVSMVDQTGKYADISLMVIARGVRQPVMDSPTETIYEYPKHTQTAYWQAIFASMLSLREEAFLPTNTRIIAAENCMSQYSNEQHRTSRTIGDPHTHIFALHEKHVDTTDKKISHLEKERAAAKQFMPDFLHEVKQNMSASAVEITDLSVRDELPHGYTITVPGELETFYEDPSIFAMFMADHHKAYKRAATKNGGSFMHMLQTLPQEDNVIPQPSYRLFLEHTNNALYISISPEFLSHAGPMEAAGIMLDRSEEHPARYHEDLLHDVQSKAVKKAIKS